MAVNIGVKVSTKTYHRCCLFIGLNSRLKFGDFSIKQQKCTNSFSLGPHLLPYRRPPTQRNDRLQLHSKRVCGISASGLELVRDRKGVAQKLVFHAHATLRRSAACIGVNAGVPIPIAEPSSIACWCIRGSVVDPTFAGIGA